MNAFVTAWNQSFNALMTVFGWALPWFIAFVVIALTASFVWAYSSGDFSHPPKKEEK